MARIKVVDPVTGVTVTVDESSPQAKAWGRKDEPRKPGRPKKQD